MKFADIVFVYHLRDERQIAWHGRYHRHGPALHEFHYFVSGEGDFRNGSALFSIQPGTLYQSPPGTDHQIVATSARKPITYYAVLVDAADDDELGSLLDSLWAAGPRGRDIGGSHRFFFADLLEKHFSGRRELILSAHHGFMAFLYSLAAGTISAYGAPDNAHVEKALAIMQSSIEKNLDLGAICTRIELSREHFVRLFTERMNMPPMKYYARLKIEAARAMLSSTNYRVGAIADRLGYENQFNFARAFKRICGMSPSEYRSRCLQRADFLR